MKGESRTAILWVGLPLADAEFKTRDLTLKQLVSVADLDGTDVRALALVTDDLKDSAARQSLVKDLRQYAERAAQSGVLIVVVCPRGHEATALTSARSGAMTLAQMQQSSGTPFTQVRVMPSDNVAAIAEAMARYDTGPSQNPDLQLIDDHGQPFPLPAEIALLVRRAFWEFGAVELRGEVGGRSAADGVWRVVPSSPDGGLRSPFIVKSGSIADIDVHVNTYRDVVEDRVPYRGCAPVCVERSPRGATRRIIVSRFVENAKRLDAVVLERDVSELVAAIYTRVLRRWRSAPAHQKNVTSPATDFMPAAVWHKSYKFQLLSAHRAHKALGAVVDTPATIYKRIKGTAAAERPFVRAHNDLNIRNVFACDGTSDPVLIDFTRAMERPLSYDCVRLDVGLAFDVEVAPGDEMPEDVIRALYTGDLFTMPLEHKRRGAVAKHRIAAIEAVRSQVLADAENHGFDVTHEYTVGICTSLLYFARRKGAIGKLAYECAAELSKRI